MASGTTNPNYSNSSVTAVDTKTTVVGVQDENNGSVIDLNDAKNKRSTAAKAEQLWLEAVARPGADYTSGKGNTVRLVSTAVSSGASTGEINTGVDQITFKLTPEISESKQVIYGEIGDIRQAASILIYGGSPSRKWSFTAKFLSRTMEEANTTWKSVQMLRAWTNPDTNYAYGYDTGTPNVVKLYGYGRTWQGIPVVLTSLNVDYPTDIDYIPTEYGTNVPVIQSVTFQLTEARTVTDLLDKFDLEKFKRGVLPSW
jgi:hypothetical protein